MKPFFVSEANEKLRERYPPTTDFVQAANTLDYKGRVALLCLVITEGVPAAFQNCPLLYESLRNFIAGRLDVHAKEVTLIGSARLGYSLAPSPKFGQTLSSSSDLDFSVISKGLFKQLSDVFGTWQADFDKGVRKPRNQTEGKFWIDNLNRLPANIHRGFIDPYKIPNLYPLPSSISETLWLSGRKLAITPLAPQFKRLTLRVYSDWDDILRQQLLNLQRTLKSLQ